MTSLPTTTMTMTTTTIMMIPTTTTRESQLWDLIETWCFHEDIIDIIADDDNNTMYHTIQNQTRPDLTIPNQSKFPYIDHNSVVFQTRSSKFGMEFHVDNIYAPYNSKPNQISLNSP